MNVSYQRSAIDGRPNKLKGVLRNKLKAVSRSPKATLRAFTIIELLTVIAIISALAALTLGVGHYAREKAKTSHTKAEMALIENALERYKSDNGAYPAGDNSTTSSIAIYQALVTGSKTYMTFAADRLQTNIPLNSNSIIDDFGRPYYYQSPGASNPATYDLWSAGPDAKTNNADDIVNWRQ